MSRTAFVACVLSLALIAPGRAAECPAKPPCGYGCVQSGTRGCTGYNSIIPIGEDLRELRGELNKSACRNVTRAKGVAQGLACYQNTNDLPRTPLGTVDGNTLDHLRND